MSDQRDHLINDATGLPQRFELRVAGNWWVVGARDNGAVSVFAGEDFVLQFNPGGELRRLFADGVRFKAVAGNLVRATRASDRGSMRLELSELSPDDWAKMERRVESTLENLRDSLGQAEADSTLLGRAIGPDSVAFVSQIRQWAFQQCESGLAIAAEPHVG